MTDPSSANSAPANAGDIDVEWARTRLAAIAALRITDTRERARFGREAWSWFAERVNLLDPLAEMRFQLAPYPDFPYTRALVAEIQEHKQFILWKSRRMIASWTMLAEFVRRAAHIKNQRLYVISRVEGENVGEGARELIWRIGWLVDNLREGPRIHAEVSKLQVVFPDTGSTITGMGGNEPNKMRQMTANAVFCDEFGFWDKPEEAYQALRPTMEGRGQVIIACSTAMGFFKQIVLDEGGSWMAPDASLREKPKLVSDAVQYCDGFDCWTNPGNGFRVGKLLHWADPRKPVGGDWERQERKGMTERAWRQEQLCEFFVNAGTPVFLHEWDRKRMVVDPLPADDWEGRPLVVAVDFGYNRPAMTVSVFLWGRVWRVLRAYMGQRVHFTPFMKQALIFLAEWFPSVRDDDRLWCCDQSGKQQGRDSDPEIEIMKKQFGIRPRFKYSKVAPTIDRMRDFMTDTYRGAPCFQIERHASTRQLIEALDSGYRFPKARSDKPEPEDPEKDGYYEHLMDCLRYTVITFGGARMTRRTDLSAIAKRDILVPHVYGSR